MIQAPAIRMEPSFEAGRAGRLFSLRVSPAERLPKGGILYLPPYGEEMHKSRRMAALQARRFAADGWLVQQFDLYGCGDSDGDSGDGHWELWREDACLMLRRLRASVEGPLLLWGLRLGGALAADVSRTETVETLILWQPVVSGEQYLNHLLRLKLAGDLIKSGQPRHSVGALRNQLGRGLALEIAGNRLSPALAGFLTGYSLAASPPPGRAIWMEVVARPDADLSAPSARCIESWQAAGVTLTIRRAACPNFWQSQEIQECAALVEATSETLGHQLP